MNEGGQRIPVAEYYLYNEGMDLKWWVNDIAILRLAKKIILGDHVGLVEWRDSPSARYDGEVATAIGWGKSSKKDPMVNLLYSKIGNISILEIVIYLTGGKVINWSDRLMRTR